MVKKTINDVFMPVRENESLLMSFLERSLFFSIICVIFASESVGLTLENSHFF